MRYDVFLVLQAQNQVGFGQVILQLGLVSFGQTAGDDQTFTVRVHLEVGGLKNGGDRLFLGGLDESAGIDDHDIGFRRVFADAIAVAFEETVHPLGVDRVFRASEGYERDSIHR